MVIMFAHIYSSLHVFVFLGVEPYLPIRVPCSWWAGTGFLLACEVDGLLC